MADGTWRFFFFFFFFVIFRIFFPFFFFLIFFLSLPHSQNYVGDLTDNGNLFVGLIEAKELINVTLLPNSKASID
jgi:hypothetical protein